MSGKKIYTFYLWSCLPPPFSAFGYNFYSDANDFSKWVIIFDKLSDLFEWKIMR